MPTAVSSATIADVLILGAVGQDFPLRCEVRIVGDEEKAIVEHSMRSGIAAPMNEARLRMTRIPKGASSTRCQGTPGFRKCNRDGAGQTRGRGHADVVLGRRLDAASARVA